MILSVPLVALAIMYVLLGLFLSKWWISICVMVVVFLIYVILGAMIFGNKTEEIAENDSPEYKNYQERKEEKKILEENQLEPELPKLKSFKK
jgi:small-conductance mechanosensitive channel